MDQITIQEIKNQLENYLHSKGINTKKPFHCLNPSHDDKNPSMSYKNNKVKCFACEASYDIYDLIGLDYNLTNFADQAKKACEIYNIPYETAVKPDQNQKPAKPEKNDLQNSPETDEPEDYKPFYMEAHETLKNSDYMRNRGISEQILERFNIGYVEAWKHPKIKTLNVPTSPRVIIPTSDYSYIARDVRPLEEIPEQSRPYVKQKVGKAHIFNLEAFNRNEPIYIVEGEIDALSIAQAGYEAIATGSVSNINLLVKEIEKIQQTKPINQLLLIAMDNDPAGTEASQKLAAELTKIKTPYYIAKPYGEHKDANDALLSDLNIFKDNLQKSIETAKKEKQAVIDNYYRDNSGLFYMAKFINDISQRDTPAIKTGFTDLDQTLDGGLYEGLYFLGAVSSLGKTTYLLQMADQIAVKGNDVIFFSLEMARNELIAKSLSRLTLMNALTKGIKTNAAKTTRGITDYARYEHYNQTEQNLIQEAMDTYLTYAKHVFIHEGLGEMSVNSMRKIVEKHISITGTRPVVFIDYLQIIAPHDERADYRLIIDHAVKELKHLSRDYKIPVIAVSSFNRANYRSEVSMESFKESGGIEYSSDILFALQFKRDEFNGEGKPKPFDIEEAEKKDPREIELKILKNRNGQTGATIDMLFYPKFNYYQERLYPMLKKGV